MDEKVDINFAGIAQLVEHNLAKVGVASSNLVSRSKFFHPMLCLLGKIETSDLRGFFSLAGWQNGYAADCKSVYLGSTPGPASIFQCSFILK